MWPGHPSHQEEPLNLGLATWITLTNGPASLRMRDRTERESSRQPQPSTRYVGRQYWPLDSTKLPDNFWHMAEPGGDQEKNLPAEAGPNCQHTKSWTKERLLFLVIKSGMVCYTAIDKRYIKDTSLHSQCIQLFLDEREEESPLTRREEETATCQIQFQMFQVIWNISSFSLEMTGYC